MAADLEQIAMDAAYQADRMDVYEQLSETRRRRLEATTSAIAAMKTELKDYADAKEVAQEAKLAAHEARLQQNANEHNETRLRNVKFLYDISQLEAETSVLRQQVSELSNDVTTARLDLAKSNLVVNNRNKEMENYKAGVAASFLKQQSNIQQTISALFRMAEVADKKLSGNDTKKISIEDILSTEFPDLAPKKTGDTDSAVAVDALGLLPVRLGSGAGAAAGAAPSPKTTPAPSKT